MVAWTIGGLLSTRATYIVIAEDSGELISWGCDVGDVAEKKRGKLLPDERVG